MPWSVWASAFRREGLDSMVISKLLADGGGILAEEFAHEAWAASGGCRALIVPERALQGLLDEVRRLRDLETIMKSRVAVKCEVAFPGEPSGES
jgi:hypothetical protein